MTTRAGATCRERLRFYTAKKNNLGRYRLPMDAEIHNGNERMYAYPCMTQV